MTKGGFKVVAMRGGSRSAVPPSIAPSPTIAIVTLDVVVRRQGGGFGNDSVGDVLALAATKAGGGQRDESGRGEEDDAMMTVAAAMLRRKGRRWGDRHNDDGKEEVVEVRWMTTKVAAGERRGRGVLKDDGGWGR